MKTAMEKIIRDRLFGMVVSALVIAGVAGCRVAKMSDFGFDPDDSTEIVQRALDSCNGRLVFDRQPGPWVVRPLFIRSNTEVVFEEGVEIVAKEDAFHGLRDALVTLHGVTNVTLRGLGRGATLRMRIKDYQGPAYSHGEWRHAVNLLSASGITIENLTLADSGGDGIYIGANPSVNPCRNVVIRDCICDNNNRQGVSVISVDGLLIERTAMRNTRGTAPRSGIDFEPNAPCQLLKNIVVRDCLTEANDGCGYELYAAQLGADSEPVDITLESCRSSGDRLASLKVALGVRGKKGLPRGKVVARNCTFADCKWSSVRVENNPHGAIGVVLENCTIERRAGLAQRIPDVKLVTDDLNAAPTDGVDFRKVTIRREAGAGEWFAASQMPWSSVGMENVNGTVRLVRGEKEEVVLLDDSWRKAVFPRSDERCAMDEIAFDPAKVGRVVDERPGEQIPFSPMTMRFALNAIVYALKPGRVTFAAKLVRVNSRTPKDGRFVVKDMKGRVVATLPAVGEKEETRTVAVPAAGFYRIECDVKPHGLVMTSCDAPIGFLPPPNSAIDIYKSEGDMWFAHGEGMDETFFCGGSSEAATVSLFAPSGKRHGVWRNQTDWGFKRIGPDAETGLWRVKIEKPDTGYRWEDAYFVRTGAPAVYFLTKEKYWMCSGERGF